MIFKRLSRVKLWNRNSWFKVSLRTLESLHQNMTTEKSFANGAEFPPLADGTLRIYSMRFCSYAHRTRLVLAHKDIPHEIVNVRLIPSSDKPDWFLERNPLGLVPVLEKDGKIVYESLVCNEYLDAMYSEKPLTPSDPYQKAQDSMLLARFGKVTDNYYKVLDGDDEARRAMLTALQPFEEELGNRGDFFGGKSVSVLDYNLWPHLERLPVLTMMFDREFITKDRFPNLHAYYQRMMALPSVQKCHVDNETQRDFLRGYVHGCPNFDLGLDK